MFWEWGERRTLWVEKRLGCICLFFVWSPSKQNQFLSYFGLWESMLFSCGDADWVLTYSADILTKTKSLGKKTNQLNVGMENPWRRTFACVWCETAIKYIEVYWQRGENASWGLKSGSMPFCTLRISSHMHKSAHVINWPVWSFFFPEN